MKFIRFFRLLSAILLFAAIHLNAGWIQKGDYLELDRKIPGTNVITFDETGNYFYTFSGDSCLRRWDRVTGEVVDSVRIKFSGRFTTCTFSSDKKVFCLVYTKDDFLKDYVFFEAYSLNSFEKLDSAKITVGDPGGDHGYYVYNYFTKIDYSYFNQYFIIGHGFSQSSTTMGITDFSYNGSLFSLSGRNNKNTTLADGFINTFNIYKNQNRSVYVTSRGYSSQQYDYDYLTVYISDTSFTTSQKILDYSQKSGSSSTYYKVKNAILNQYDSCIYFTSEENKILRTYDYSKKIYLKDYEMPATTSYWINMSDDSRFLFLPYFNHLRILHPQTKTQIAEYNFDADLISYSYNIDNNGLISLTKSNTIELRYPEKFVVENDFIVSDTLVYPNIPISFYYNGPKKITKYFWDFGDGTTSEERSPVHSYQNTGSYTIELTVTYLNNKEIKIKKQNLIRVIDALKANFIYYLPDSLDYNNIQFESTSKGEIISYKWDFGDGQTAFIPNPKHKFKIDAQYLVTLEIEESTHKKTTKQEIIYVSKVPINIKYNYQVFNTYFNVNLNVNTELKTIGLNKILAKNGKIFGIYNYSSYDHLYKQWGGSTNFFSLDNTLNIKKILTGYKDINLIDKEGENELIILSDYGYDLLDLNCDTIFSYKVGNKNKIFYYADKSGNCYSFYGKDDSLHIVKSDLLSLKFDTLKTSIFKGNNGIYFTETNDDVICYSNTKYYCRISKIKNTLDTFPVPVNGNFYRMIGLESGTVLIFVYSKDNYITNIYEINSQNKIRKSVFFSNYLIRSPQIKKINNKLIAIFGKLYTPGYILIDTNLQIVYQKYFHNYANNFDDLSLFNDSTLVMACFRKANNNDNLGYLFTILDTIPREITDKYIVSTKYPSYQGNESIQVLPNPASDDVEFILPKSAISGVFEIYNQQSQRVFILEDVSDRLNLNTQIFPTGVYFCVFKTKDKVISQKFMVVH